ncbi:39S ribosomal protein L38 [Mactra antiquata]
MAASMLQKSKIICRRLSQVDSGCLLKFVRTKHKYRHRGLPPELSKTWVKRKAEIEMIPPEENMAVNIGFPVDYKSLRRQRRTSSLSRSAEELAALERKSRHRELVAPIEEVMEENFLGQGQQSVHTLASHYGIFKDLFGDAYFYSQLQLEVGYQIEEEPDMLNRVFYGNPLTPVEANKQPDVYYKADPDKLYTLCMVAPDSHLEHNNKEYLHWMVGNIPGCSVQKGEVVCDYLPLFPVKGTGYHRYVFILYQQEHQVDYSTEKRSSNCTSLRERTFETLEFYRERQDDITPVGICFFQAEWDNSVRNVFHNILDMNEPRFEFLPPAPYVPKQKIWPFREPFHVYMDRYRDVKDIQEEVLVEKLRNADPFKPRPQAKKYPNVCTVPDDTPSWLRLKLTEQRLKKSYWKYLDD